ncbi:LEAF RUST 10 DISEASE-RESISTANCE LOCUS RECEPTOR-LIKE PROTEIN KINASE-like 1.3 isoform X4 [Cucurbita pepo subsp. pepo]|uniref:LEAF RUST 10 DISEASE-RESISTANCE LOCUS RECEPTOR-LIKE PROTEIN KINASE-like 1.3 isoform X4 n=1 Tax=Cucurbita pepo subsp. pepo TaxID=3664 RepID=UPI000C9D9C55|nr:LEAF RUST 10 DISEASE-RESISTANCE LOCUS RECEPTOR-LIKE PROTEIN KINASE-like 1.3 isoform X4 [Cucurbita pepo subsp. pepo]
MATNPSKALLLALISIATVLIQPPTLLCDGEEEKYRNCNSSLKCLTYPNLGYPFWGLNRPDYCGHPSFELSCREEALEIAINSIAYRILEINTNTHTLRVVRKDYWNNICPQSLKNTTFDSNLFYYSSNTQPLKLLYDCASLPVGLPGQFRCNINSTNYVNLIVTQNSEARNSSNTMKCNHSVDVAISRSMMQSLQSNPSELNLKEALETGFELQWRIDNRVCYECHESGGQCGSDPSLGEFTCYCLDGAFKTTCGSTPSEATKTKKTATEKGIIIGASVGGAFLVATILGFCIFFCLGKKKKKHPVGYVSKEAALSPPVSDPLSDKDMPPAPLLNSFQTHSIPSYPSSKSDLERPSPNSDIQVFSYAELEKATQNFNRSRELGDGGFGTVYYGKLDDGREVAVKRLYEHNCKRVEQFMNEVNILADLQHKNLVKLYGCTSKFSQGLLLVYEYIPNGTVADHLHGSRVKFGLLSWPIRLRIAIETANALIYLHRKDIIHRDVKTNNILLDSTCTIKVADFGLSRLFPTDVTHVSTAPQGTPGYVDPEYYQCYQLTTKSDVYSFGVVLIELISSLRAVDTDRKRQDINLSNMAVSKIQNRALNELIDPKLGFDKNPEVMRATTSVAELAFRCLQQERDMRPSMEEVVEVLREIENDKSSSEMSKVVDTGVVEDDIEITKRTPPAFSPNSVIDDNWVSSSTITNSL